MWVWITKKRNDINNIKKIDLHMHSSISDGTDSPEEIIKKVMDAGIDLFSLTDHDSVKGATIVRDMLSSMDTLSKPEDQSGKDMPSEEEKLSVKGGQPDTEDDRNVRKLPVFVSGVEFSCRDSDGRYHILGYGYDPSNPRCRLLADKVHGFRMQKAKDRLDYLDIKYGIRFSDEDVDNYIAMENPGKPQLGNLLVSYGYAPDRSKAIEQYINNLRIKSSFIYPEEAIDVILDGGGVPVLAHPSLGSGGEYIMGYDMELRLRHLIGMGLQGVEAYYSRFTNGMRSEMLYFAEKFGLYVTAGSDYHGSNKRVELGDNKLGDARQGAQGLIRFISRILGDS